MSVAPKLVIAAPAADSGASNMAWIAAANAPDIGQLCAELDRLRGVVHDLRNPVGAVRLAVQMLAGPLRSSFDGGAAAQVARIEAVLGALQTATTQLCHLVGELQPRSPVRAWPTAPSPAVAADSARSADTEASTAALPPSAAARGPCELGELVAKLEVMTVTRSVHPAILTVDVPDGLRPAIGGPQLLRTLSNLVENAIEASVAARPGVGPWPVGIVAYLDPAEVLGDELDVVIEIRDCGPGMPERWAAWLRGQAPQAPASTKPDDGVEHGLGLRVVRELVMAADGSLDAQRQADHTVVSVRIPSA